jgi:predicted nucleotidyltransferase
MRIVGVVVDFIEGLGIESYSLERGPTSIVLALPNEPESLVPAHIAGLRKLIFADPSLVATLSPAVSVVQDPRNPLGILVELESKDDAAARRDNVVRALRGEESELRRRGVNSLTLFGGVAKLKPFTNDIDLVARFERGKRPTSFDLSAIESYLGSVLRRRVDVSLERALSKDFRRGVEEHGVRIFG